MRPRRDPKRKPPSEQALREALRRDLPPEDAASARLPSKAVKPKPRKKRKRPVRSADAPRDPADRDGGDEARGRREEDAEGFDAPASPAARDGAGPGEAPDDAPDASDHEARHDPRVEDLEDKVKQLTEALEGMSSEKSELEGVAEKFKGMEDRMKSLLQLSEVLSVRYNPFLSNEEGDVFDGSRHDPSSLLPRERPRAGRDGGHRPSEVLRPAPAPVEDRFRGEVVRVEQDEPSSREAEGPPEETAEDELDAALEAALAPFHEEPEGEPWAGSEDHDEAPGPDADEEGEEALDPDEAATVRAEALEPLLEPDAAETGAAETEAETVHPAPSAPAPAHAPPAEPAAQAPQAPPARAPHLPVPPALPARPATTGRPGPSPPFHAPGRSRESYLALCWFERLAREGDPCEVHLFVDHYAGLGWIPPEHHGWMAYLAESVAPRRPGLTWADVETPAHELARLHRRNLRFLDRLFRCGLGVDDPLRWDDEAQWWMEGE